MQFSTMIFHMFLTMWLLCVMFESVESATHDIHRIVLQTTHYRRNRDREYDHHNQNHHSTHGHSRNPVFHESQEDEWSSAPSTTNHHYHYSNNFRPNTKNENSNGYKRGKTRYHNSSTIKSLNIAELIELTTSYPEKLPVPIIDSFFQTYYQPTYPVLNNSIDVITPDDIKKPENTINITFLGKARHLREKELNNPRNLTKGYEVYEEIIGDISPPPLPDLKHNNNIQSYPVLNTPIPSVLKTPLPTVSKISIPSVSVTPTAILKEEENHIKENVSNVANESENTTRAYGKRTKSRRNRGNVKAQ